MARKTGIRGVSIAPYRVEKGPPWIVRISTGDGLERVRTSFVSRGSWGEALAEAIRRRDAGRAVGGDTTLRRYFAEVFLPAKRRAGRTRSTLEAYEGDFRRYIDPVLGGRRLSSLIYDDAGAVLVQRWLGWLAGPDSGARGGLGLRSQLRALRLLGTILSHAGRGQRRAWNPVTAIPEEDRPQARRPRRPASSIEVALGVVAAFEGTKWDAAVALGLGAGLRRGEILGMPIDALYELDGPDPRVEVRQVATETLGGARIEKRAKTESSLRVVSLPAWVAAKVRRQVLVAKEARIAAGPRWEDHGLLFPRSGRNGRPGAPIGPATFSREFRRILLAAGFEGAALERVRSMHLHDLRHAHVTLAVTEGGLPLEVVGRRVGHAAMATTEGYFEPDRAADRRVARAFDDLFGEGVR